MIVRQTSHPLRLMVRCEKDGKILHQRIINKYGETWSVYRDCDDSIEYGLVAYGIPTLKEAIQIAKRSIVHWARG